jgi:hypothetical protein
MAETQFLTAGFDGGSANFCIARYNTNGTLDLSFNATGFITQPVGGALGVTLQSNGKIIAASNDDTLDLSFNTTRTITYSKISLPLVITSWE